ncbi:hypothetical protein CALCODRAFT_488891 [Calocera cornea HHB12733]|uniref:Mid2 domain-containing protein n=1 Tax=Calocera cornea HHB12733 TaxID=1353952 RepID=A0A165C3J0_9BASI|nr:hypothetical protein CALCODRAFT_488891 [Calocera cornea HHB12733]
MAPLTPLALAALLPLLVPAWGWSFTLENYPTQCTALTWSWSGGTAPHSFSLIALSGINASFSSWTTGTVAEIAADQACGTDDTCSIEFQWPAGTPVVIVGSDAEGFGTGGTSDVYTVQPSSVDSCVSSTTNSSYYATVPAWSDPPAQCMQMLSGFHGIAWPPEIKVIIPGGESSVVESPQIQDNTTAALLFWNMTVPAGTNVAYVVEDANGPLFVSSLRTVGAGSSACIQGGAYSSTAAPAAGALSTSPPATSSSGHSSTGAIAGGVVGGVAGLVLLVALTMFIMRRYNRRKMLARRQTIGLVAYAATRPERLERGTWPEGERYKDNPGRPSGDEF